MAQNFLQGSAETDNIREWIKINTNRAEGRGANARLFYLTSISNFIVT